MLDKRPSIHNVKTMNIAPMPKLRLAFMLLLLTPFFNGYSQDSVSKEIDRSKLYAAVHEHLHTRIKKDKIAGASVLVAQNGKIVLEETAGYADEETNRKLKENDVFRLASMSKPLTAVALFILVDRKQVALDDPIYKYIPEFKTMKVALPNDKSKTEKYKADPNTPPGTLPASSNYHLVAADRPITIRDLLTHSSGIVQGPAGYAEAKKITLSPDMTLADYIPKIAQVPLEFQPGTRTGYSPNGGLDICGRIVEIVSGKPLDAFMDDEVFKPLDMNNTGFIKNGAFPKTMVTLYTGTDSGLVKAPNQYPFSVGTAYFAGSAGITGTIDDYYHFAQMLADGGVYKGHRILSQKIVDEMATPQLPDSLTGFVPGCNWGLSVRVTTSGPQANQPLSNKCFGWSGAFGTHFWIDPVNHVVGLYFNNMTNGGGAGAETARELERDVMYALGYN